MVAARSLELQDAEGPQAAVFEGLTGKVISLDDSVIVVESKQAIANARIK